MYKTLSECADKESNSKLVQHLWGSNLIIRVRYVREANVSPIYETLRPMCINFPAN